MVDDKINIQRQQVLLKSLKVLLQCVIDVSPPRISGKKEGKAHLLKAIFFPPRLHLLTHLLSRLEMCPMKIATA